LRETLRDLSAQKPKTKLSASHKTALPSVVSVFTKLRNYCAEFSGKRRAFKPRKVYPNYCHGLVVDALNESLRASEKVFKSWEIDLVAVRGDRVILFEVKTSSDLSQKSSCFVWFW
jgi:hypothetical protein